MFDDIRDKLEGWEAPAPEGLWQRIEAAQESTGAQEKRSSGKIRPAIRWITVAAGTAAAAVTLLIMLFRPAQDSTDIPLTAEVLTERNQPETAIGTPGADATTGTEKTGAANEAAAMKESRPAESTDIQTHTVLNSGGPRLPARAAADITATHKDRVHEQVAGTAERRVIERAEVLNENRLSNRDSGRPERTLSADMEGREEGRRPAGLFSVGISSSNSPGSTANRQGYTGMSGYQAAPMSLSSSNPTGLWIDPDANMRYANQGEDVSTDTRYRLPVRTGVTLRYSLPSGVGFETGLTYTWLSSTLQSGSEQNHYTAATQIHYIGIPLNVSYTFVHSRYVDVYASAGGLMEKCVGGSIRTEYILDSRDLGTDRTETLSTKPLQWSINATAGVQLNITPAVGLYAEPGAAYYFDDGTFLQTTYKARPLNFYLRFGLRFSFGL